MRYDSFFRLSLSKHITASLFIATIIAYEMNDRSLTFTPTVIVNATSLSADNDTQNYFGNKE